MLTRLRNAWLGISTVIALALVLAVLVVVQTRPEDASAAFPGSNGKIAFHSGLAGNAEVYAMNADGGGLVDLSNNAAAEHSPSWSPDGAKVTFSSSRDGNYEIYTMNADGSAQTRLTNNGASDGVPSWSPDGMKIAFNSNRSGGWQVYVMNADGSGQTPLTSSGSNGMPVWSPDGTRIALSSARNANPFEIYVMNADGGGQTPLGTGPSGEHLDWSPDGSRIAYEKGGDIWVMNADGSAQAPLVTGSGDDAGPGWSPDGTQIAFASFRTGNYEIYLANADGSGQVQVTQNSSYDLYPKWQRLCDASCPTPVPLHSPTPTPVLYSNGIDFSIGTGPSSGARNTCDSSGTPTNVCQVSSNGLFRVNLYLNQLPAGMQGGKYQGYDTRIQYSGVSQDGTSASVNFSLWPDCALTGLSLQQGDALAGCAVGVGSLGSTYTGKLVSIEFHCVADGTVTLVHGGAGNTALVDSVTSFSESGSEALSIDCSDVTPPPPTPGPEGVDFSIRVSSGGSVLCDSSGIPTDTCAVPQGAPFAVDLILHHLPTAMTQTGYYGFDGTVGYQGVTHDQGVLSAQRWPDCVYDAYYADATRVATGCATGSGAPASLFTGRLATFYFVCLNPGSVTQRIDYTDIVDNNLVNYAEAAEESLHFTCVAPQPYPADADGDHCPDSREATSNAMTGGLRDFGNEWDYLNPTHDGNNMVDDILAVVYKYHVDQGMPGYTPDTDRTFVGPNRWNLGPPDGKQRVEDILNAVYQYHHNCSAG